MKGGSLPNTKLPLVKGMTVTRKNAPAPPLVPGYWTQSQQPLQVLIFLLPFLAVYEVGLLWFKAKSRPNLAEVLLQKFFLIFGVDNPTLSYHLPALVIVVVLVTWHLTRRDKATFDPRTYIGMLIEAVLLAMPLFVFGLMLFRGTQPSFATSWSTAGVHLLESIGAGLYEEFVFRVLGIALVHAILVDLLALPEKWGAAGAITITAVLFSAAHFYAQSFHWGKFLYFAAAGVFFAIVYLLRGYGIAAGAHAAYNTFIVLQMMRM